MKKHIKNILGFTLVELSIVLIIVGLLIAGVFGGEELIKISKQNGVVSDMKQIAVAYNSFLSQYGNPPGDISDGENYFGSAVNNGNGDGFIESSGTVNEGVNAYMMLKESELYNRTTNTDPDDIGDFRPGNAGKYIPVSKGIKECSFTLAAAAFARSAWFAARLPKNSIIVRRLQASGNARMFMGCLSPLNAQAVDEKMDDGKAYYGNLRIYMHPSRLCGSSSDRYANCGGVFSAKPPGFGSESIREKNIKFSVYWTMEQ